MIIFVVLKGDRPLKIKKIKEEKMAALFGGLVALVLGIIGIIIWWGYFVKALAAGIPTLLILGGALATYLGIEEWKDKRSAQKFDDESDTSKLKEEVKSIKKEVEDLKKEE
jgi:fatty acid desaturase